MPDARWLPALEDGADPAAVLEAVTPYWPRVDEVYPPEALGPLLAAAAEQCEAYAPPLPEAPAPLPESSLLAQAMQARALWRSGTVGGGDQYGGGEFTVTVFPMDWTVKLLLRPKRMPVVR